MIPFELDPALKASPHGEPPATMNNDEAMILLQRWLDRFAESVQDGAGENPAILTAEEISKQSGVPQANAILILNVALQNDHFGVTARQLQSGKFCFDVGNRKIRNVRRY